MMRSLEDRLSMVMDDVWKHLPPIKQQATVADVILDDLGAVHGSFSPETCIIKINYRLVRGDSPQHIPLIDVNGNDPPHSYPCISRAWHTLCHECFHAIGYATGFDESQEWLSISGWTLAPDDPVGTARYWERRPGWTPQGPSEWRHTLGTWLVRSYSEKTPHEDFADACTHIALGWGDFFTGSGVAKLTYLRRTVWGESGRGAIAASRERWAHRLRSVTG